MKLLFWNTKNKDLIDEIVDLVEQEDCHIAGFCETDDKVISEVLVKLKTMHNKDYYYQSCPGCERIKLIVKNEINHLQLLQQHKYFSLIKVKKFQLELILAFVHFPSKAYNGLDVIRSVSEILHKSITNEEKINNTQHTLIIGDFNVNPFEMPMVSFSGMNATNSTDCLHKDTLTRLEESKRLFFNPMWSLYALHNKRPGTHKYRRLDEDVISWHFLDQVIIRPSLIDFFDINTLQLIFETTNYKFTNVNGKPNVSDHLPLSCQLTI